MDFDPGPRLASQDRRESEPPIGPRTSTEPSQCPRLALLGGFELRLDAEIVSLPMSAQRLVAFLALQGKPLLRVYVAGSLWPDTSTTRALASLRSALWRLGNSGDTLVHTTNDHLELSPEVDVDVRRSIALARRILDYSLTLPESEAEELSSCKDLLPDWYDDWLIIEREHFHQLRLHALESLCERLTVLGRFAKAVEAGLAAVAAQPLRESAHRALIKAYMAEGNLAEASRQYRFFRQLLHEELGLNPSDVMENIAQSFAIRGG